MVADSYYAKKNTRFQTRAALSRTSSVFQPGSSPCVNLKYSGLVMHIAEFTPRAATNLLPLFSALVPPLLYSMIFGSKFQLADNNSY